MSVRGTTLTHFWHRRLIRRGRDPKKSGRYVVKEQTKTLIRLVQRLRSS
jgi:hypothetical protein